MPQRVGSGIDFGIVYLQGEPPGVVGGHSRSDQHRAKRGEVWAYRQFLFGVRPFRDKHFGCPGQAEVRGQGQAQPGIDRIPDQDIVDVLGWAVVGLIVIGVLVYKFL